MVRSKLSDVEVPQCTLPQLVFAMCDTYRHKIALVDGVTGQSYTYAQLRHNITNVASGLVRLGVKKGDIVAINSPNNPDYGIIFFAILEVGATVTTVNPAYTAYELGKQLADSGATFMYTVRELIPVVQQAISDNSLPIKHIISLGGGQGCVPFSQLLEDDGGAYPGHSLEMKPEEDVAVIPYSSGTTGLPKGVMLTHSNIVSNLMQTGHESLKKPELQDTTDDHQEVIMGFLPFYHSYGMVICLAGGLSKGFKIVTLPKFVPQDFLHAIQYHKVTAVSLVPPVIIFLVNSPLVAKYDLSSIKLVGSGAAPLAPDVARAFRKLVPNAKLLQGYGLTETSPVVFTSPARGGHFESVGIILPNTEVMVVDVETGRELGAGERGELWVRGPQVMKGYLHKPDATRHTIDANHWLHTGDIGYYNDKGYFYIVDRIKELIKVKGFQVAPAELEALLLTHPDVADVGVVGVPHTRLGEAPKAFVVLQPGSTVSSQRIQQFVKARVTNYKQLSGGVHFLSSIPKSPAGKILRRKLREMVAINPTSNL